MFQPVKDRVHSVVTRQDTRHGDASCGILERPIDLVGHESPTAAMTDCCKALAIFPYSITEMAKYFRKRFVLRTSHDESTRNARMSCLMYNVSLLRYDCGNYRRKYNCRLAVSRWKVSQIYGKQGS